jgi:hypothetical protein
MHVIRSFCRGSGLVLLSFLSLLLLGVAGCGGESNEAALQEQASKVGTKPAADAPPPPTNMDDYAARQKKMLQGKTSYGAGYPGTGGRRR